MSTKSKLKQQNSITGVVGGLKPQCSESGCPLGESSTTGIKALWRSLTGKSSKPKGRKIAIAILLVGFIFGFSQSVLAQSYVEVFPKIETYGAVKYVNSCPWSGGAVGEFLELRLGTLASSTVLITHFPDNFVCTYEQGQNNNIIFNLDSFFSQATTTPIEGQTYLLVVRELDKTINFYFRFIINSGNYIGVSGVNPEPLPVVCDTFDLGCYIKQAFAWAFLPSQESINQFQTLTLMESFPFSYIPQLTALRPNIFEQTNSLSIVLPFGSFGSITLISEQMLLNIPYSNTIKTIFSYMLWILLGTYVYRKILTIHNRDEKI